MNKQKNKQSSFLVKPGIYTLDD